MVFSSTLEGMNLRLLSTPSWCRQASSGTLQRQASTTVDGMLLKSDMTMLDRFESRAWLSDFGPSHVDVDPTTVFSSHLSTNYRNESIGSKQHQPERVESCGSLLRDISSCDFWKEIKQTLTIAEANSQKVQPAKDETDSPKVQPVEDEETSSVCSTTKIGSESVTIIIPSFPRSDGSFKRKFAEEDQPSLVEERRTSPSSSKRPRVYFEPADEDVLMGRGGRSNHHPGNQHYLQEKELLQASYKAASKVEKTVIAQELVNRVHAWGGRFLELDAVAGRWFQASPERARKKCSQALREVNTPEVRAAKRARYAK